MSDWIQNTTRGQQLYAHHRERGGSSQTGPGQQVAAATAPHRSPSAADAAPAGSAAANADVQSTTTEPARTTTTILSHNNTAAPTAAAAATTLQTTGRVANTNGDEPNRDVFAENRKKNIIIKGLTDRSNYDDRREVEELLEFMFCKHRISQISNGGIKRLGRREAGKNRFLMVCFENEAAVDQIYMRRNLLEDHPYMHNVYITRDLPRSERRNQRVSNMLNEALQSGRSAYMEIPEATLSINNDRPTIPSTDNTSGGNTIGQKRATTDRSKTISEGGE